MYFGQRASKTNTKGGECHSNARVNCKARVLKKSSGLNYQARGNVVCFVANGGLNAEVFAGQEDSRFTWSGSKETTRNHKR